MSIFHEEILVIERTDVDVAVGIIADGRIGRCGCRNRNNLADGVRNGGMSSEAIVESVESGEGHAVVETRSHVEGRNYAVPVAAEAIAISEGAEAAETIEVVVMRVGVNGSQSGDCDKSEKYEDLFHGCFSVV